MHSWLANSGKEEVVQDSVDGSKPEEKSAEEFRTVSVKQSCSKSAYPSASSRANKVGRLDR